MNLEFYNMSKSNGTNGKVSKNKVVKSDDEILNEVMDEIVTNFTVSRDITNRVISNGTIPNGVISNGTNDVVDEITVTNNGTGNVTDVVSEHGNEHGIGKNNTKVMKSHINVNKVRNNTKMKRTKNQNKIKIGNKVRLDRNSTDTLNAERLNVKADYLDDDDRESFYTDVNLPIDFMKRFNQGLKKSKGFNQLEASFLVKQVEDYKKCKEPNITTELELMHNFGVLIKNVNDYKRAFIDGVTKKIHVNEFKKLDSWNESYDFSKTCISCGYIIPNEVTQTQADSRGTVSEKDRKKAIEIMFKQSVIFPNNLNFPKSKSGHRKDYFAITFVYGPYHIVLFNVALSEKSSYRGKILENGGIPVYLSSIPGEPMEVSVDVVEKVKVPSFIEIIENDLMCNAPLNKEPSAIPKMKVVDDIVVKDTKTKTRSRTGTKTSTSTRSKKKKEEKKTKGYVLDSWVTIKSKPVSTDGTSTSGKADKSSTNNTVSNVDKTNIVDTANKDSTSNIIEIDEDSDVDTVDTSSKTVEKKDDVVVETFKVEDDNQFYKDNDNNEVGESQDMIEMKLLIRNMTSNITKEVPCYVKYRSYGIQIYIAYNYRAKTRVNNVLFIPFDSSKMTSYIAYFK